MRILSVILGAVAAMALLAGPASAQGGPARYGEPDKTKTPTEIAAEKDAETGLPEVARQRAGTKGYRPLGHRARERASERSQAPAKPKPRLKTVRRHQARQHRKIEDTGPGALPG